MLKITEYDIVSDWERAGLCRIGRVIRRDTPLDIRHDRSAPPLGVLLNPPVMKRLL
jgi:hypothetical protein